MFFVPVLFALFGATVFLEIFIVNRHWAINTLEPPKLCTNVLQMSVANYAWPILYIYIYVYLFKLRVSFFKSFA